MKLPLRLALPLGLAAFLVTAAGAAGVLALVRRTTGAALDQERAQFQRIVANTLRQRADALRDVTGILVTLDGPVGARLGAWTHLPVEAAAILDGRTAAVRSAWGPGMLAADLVALRRPGSTADAAILREARGGLLLAAASASRSGRETAVAAQRLDDRFARALADLLQADVELVAEGRATATTVGPGGPAADSLPVDVALATAAGAPVVVRVHVPGAGIARARRRALAWTVAGGAVLLACALGFYVWTVRRVSRPIRELIAAADRVAAGTLDAPLPPGAPAELGTLVGQFRTMAASLKDARARLAQSAALASVGQFVAGISHELNNPLSGLLTHAEYAAGRLGPDDPGAAELAVILEEGRRLKRILQDLRGLVRPGEVGRVRLDLNLIARDVAQFVRHDAARTGVSCATELADGEVAVLGSPDQLRQVVLNLVLNALQAMPGGGDVTIATARDTEGGAPIIRLTVTDSGPGVPPDLLPRLTEPFFTTKPGRMGLGLALCDEIARAHGGRLAIAAAASRGTRVDVSLPEARS